MGTIYAQRVADVRTSKCRQWNKPRSLVDLTGEGEPHLSVGLVQRNRDNVDG